MLAYIAEMICFI